MPTVAELFQFAAQFIQCGDFARAAECYRQALAIEPNQVDAHNNLGSALLGQGRPNEAAECYRQALRINPQYANAHYNLGNILFGQGRHAEADECYRQAVQNDPAHAEAHNNLGNALRAQNRLTEAADSYRRAVEHNPNYVEAHNNLGMTLFAQEQIAAAEDCFRRALRVDANHADSRSNLGKTLFKQQRLEEAAECYRLVLRGNPSCPSAHFNLANTLMGLDHLEEATEIFQKALAMNPKHIDARNNLGTALMDLGLFEEAAESFRNALAIDAANNRVQWNQALLRLLQGDFENGWSGFAKRFAVMGTQPRTFSQPRWDGSSLEGKTILVYVEHGERGLGDTIQFARYLPLVKERGGTVVFECQAELMNLMSGLPGADQLVTYGGILPRFDVQIPLFHLPALFRTTLATIPAVHEYLAAPARCVEHWRKEVSRDSSLNVGIVWQGSLTQKYDHRSAALSYFEALARIENVRLVSLQVGPGVEQLAVVNFPVTDLGSRFDPSSLDDLAGLLMNLDLVVTVDTAVAHLAGALGVPVWTLLQFVPDWRWLLDRSDSPWYPTMRLFRQEKPREWGDVFERVAREMSTFSPGSKSRA